MSRVRAFDTDPAKIVGILTRRDQRSPSDWIRIVVDSYFDRRSAYEFGVNPVGVKTDRYYFNDGQSDDSWDAVWDVAGRAATPTAGAPSSAFRSRSCASTTPTGGPVGLRRHSRGRPPRRDVVVAAAVAQRQRLRLAVR